MSTEIENLESEVRSMMNDRAVDAGQASFSSDDLIRRGDAARRRRRLAGAGGIAVAVAGIFLAGSVIGSRPTAAPPAHPGPSTSADTTQGPGHRGPVGLDVVDGHRLRMIDGEVTVPLDLSQGRVTRVRGGWVHESADSVKVISFFDRGGSVTKLADGVELFAVGPDGEQLAWTSNKVLTTVRLDKKGDGRLVGRRSTAVQEGVVPVTWSGDRLVLSQRGSCCGGENQQYVPAKWDTWDSKAGPFVARWKTTVSAVYGPEGWSTGSLPTGSLVGVVPKTPGSGTGCLALLDPATLTAKQTRCDLGLSPDSSYGSLSAGGRYFFDAADSTGRLIDVRAAFSADPAAGAVQSVPMPNQPPVWDGGTAIATVDDQLYAWRSGSAPRKLPPFVPQGALVPVSFSAG